jgi:hypothetical protein
MKVNVKTNKLIPYSSVEELGDQCTHIFKSGSCLRPEEDLDELGKLKAELIPEKAEGIDFEYDVWFNTNEKFTIRKWLYTDFLGAGIYIRVNSLPINAKLLTKIVESDIKIDEQRIERIKSNLRNKYHLKITNEKYDKVIFPPGTNLLSKDQCVHWGKMKALVDEGYVIKPHPITTRLYVAKLKRKFGAENVLERKAGGMELLMNCSHVATMPNSEMGLIALLLNKDLRMISYSTQEREKSLLTYEALYLACANRDGHTAIKKIFSAKNSGIIFAFDEDRKHRLDLYINNFWEYRKHIK